MSYLLGEKWRDYFDVVVASAKKPAFFTDSMRPFRELNEQLLVQTWGPVDRLEKDKIYLEVSSMFIISFIFIANGCTENSYFR